jgi:transposase
MSRKRLKKAGSGVEVRGIAPGTALDDAGSASEHERLRRRKKHNGKHYGREFKVAAAKLVTERGYTPKDAAASLAIPVSTLQYWVRVYGRTPAAEAETVETLRLKNRQLEAENQRLKLEREILKKATAFFASQP